MMALPPTPTWGTKAQTPQTFNWAILRYLDGKIYCVTYQDGPGYLGLMVYTIKIDTWEFKTGPLPHDNDYAHTYRAQLAVANGKLYFVRTASRWPTGVPTNHNQNFDTYGSLQVYDVAADNWTVLATYDIVLQPHWRPYQRSSDTSPVTVLVSDSSDMSIGVGTTIYSIGYSVLTGSNAEVQQPSREFWGYDVTTDTFTQLADRPANPGDPTSFPDVILGNNDTTVFVFQANDFGNYIAAYDIAGNSWTELPTQPGPVITWPGFAVDGNTLYLLGGRGYTDPNNTPLDTIYRLDPGASEWATVGTLSVATYAPGAIIVDDILYLVAGATPDSEWTDATYVWPGGVVLRYLRMSQRNDTLGIQRAPRLTGTNSNNPSSRALGKPRRLGQSNTY